MLAGPAADESADDPGGSRWLAEQEESCSITIYQADTAATPWSHRCVMWTRAQAAANGRSSPATWYPVRSAVSGLKVRITDLTAVAISTKGYGEGHVWVYLCDRPSSCAAAPVTLDATGCLAEVDCLIRGSFAKFIHLRQDFKLQGLRVETDVRFRGDLHLTLEDVRAEAEVDLKGRASQYFPVGCVTTRGYYHGPAPEFTPCVSLCMNKRYYPPFGYCYTNVDQTEWGCSDIF